MTRFCCGSCGIEITRPVELLATAPDPPEELLGGSGADWVPVGSYLHDSGPYRDWVTLEGGPIVNEADLVNTRPDRNRWAGCCGPTTHRGPNLTCANGHHVGTVVADCTDLHGVWLTLPDAFTLTPDQPRTAGLVALGDDLVVIGSGPELWSEPLPTSRLLSVLDLDEASAHPLMLPPGLTSISACSAGKALVLCRDGSGDAVLAERRGGNWQLRSVPNMPGPGEALDLAADGDCVAVFGQGALSVLRQDRWTSLVLTPPPLPPALTPKLIPSRVLLSDNSLYLGYDRGEWGGALLILDLTTGSWSAPSVPSWGPVTALTSDPNGHVWVTMGLAHLGSRFGALGVITAYEFNEVVTVRPDPGAHQGFIAVDQEGRPAGLPGDGFYGLTCDNVGRLYILTESSGVLRQDDNGWAALTPGWPGPIGANALAVRGQRGVICTRASGVLVWDLVSGDNRAIRISG